MKPGARYVVAAMLLLTAVHANAADRNGLLAMQRYDQIVTAVGYRLATSAGDLCVTQVPIAGFALHDLSQYDAADQEEARTAFGFSGEPLVLAVAPASPAFTAGIRPGDALVRIGDVPVAPATPGASRSYDRMAKILSQLDTASQGKRLSVTLRRGKELLELTIALQTGCATKFQTKVSSSIDAKADGTYVEVNTALIDFAGTEDQLAVLMAHELAHNVLHHRARLDAAGIRRGVLGQFGKSARLVRETEDEADRLGVYLMDRAGYPLDAAVEFWRRYDEGHGLSILTPLTHSSVKQRIALVTAEKMRIAAMRDDGREPAPAF